MTLRQTLQAAPAKANELIAKLANTSNQAVKTREKLFAELSSELQLYIDLEEQHLFPILRKHPETKNLVPDAVKENRTLRTKLEELASAPKDDDAFLEKLRELQSGFQQHVRDERKELLPAVVKALSEDEAQAVAGGMEAGIADAENARREEARQAREEARREQEEAEQRAAQERAEVRAQKATERSVREAVDRTAEIVQYEATAVQEGARRMSETVASQTLQASDSMRGALTAYREAAQTTSESLRAVTASSSFATRGLTEFGSIWLDCMSKMARTSSDASRQLLQCRTLQQVAETQSEFANRLMHDLMEGSAMALQAAQRAAKQALQPLDGRLGKGA